MAENKDTTEIEDDSWLAKATAWIASIPANVASFCTDNWLTNTAIPWTIDKVMATTKVTTGWVNTGTSIFTDEVKSWDWISKPGETAANISTWITNTVGLTGDDNSNSKQTLNNVVSILENVGSQFESITNSVYTIADGLTNTLGSTLQEFVSAYGDTVTNNSTFMTVIGKVVSSVATSMVDYQDGVTETQYGVNMEHSWKDTSSSFINTFKKGGNYTVKFLSTTPLDPGSSSENLYGTMMLGTPPVFTNMTDPNSRVYINTFLKDARFLSLTPGLPKYYGGTYTTANNQSNQTKDGNSQLQYLLRNGIDSSVTDKNKRYYEFSANYEEYFAYLETMLNTVRIKMGLATEDDNTYNLYSFTDTKTNTFDSRYNNSLGFYINPSGILSESIDNSQSGTGSEFASRVNSQAATYRQTNYITGMGTGSGVQNGARTASNLINTVLGLKSTMSEQFQIANSWSSNGKTKITKLAKFFAGAVLDVGKMAGSTDTSSLIQQFNTTNGMNVKYPELWEDSGFSKSVSINFEFISPYGDPESIYQHVYVPFLALLCFAMPRQADYNGYVSPFFVRADVPGVFTTDFGMISSMTWTRGGNSDLWSKDGLPLAISGTISIDDLYPYMAMTKRLSYMSANPNYSSFLNSFAGLHAVSNNSTDSLNDYFRQMINRVSGVDNMSNSKGLYNKYSSTQRQSNKNYNTQNKANKFTGINSRSITFLRSTK